MRSLFSKSLLLAVSCLMAVSCSGSGSGGNSSDSSDFISHLTSGDSWSSDTGFSSSDPNPSQSSEQTPREATVSFATGEGTPIAPLTVETGYVFNQGDFENPTRAHYEFGGWYLDSNYNLAVSYPYVVTGNVILYAKWNIIRHLVSFVTGTSQTMNPIYVNDGEYIQEPVAPANGSYKFAGWYLDEDRIEKAYFPYVVNAPVTFYAKYEVVWRTITFHSNGGSYIDPILVEEGEIIDQPFESPTHEYFTFDAWYYDSTFTSRVYYPFIVNENLNLYARWINTEATIFFETNGGSAIDPLTIEKGVTLYSLPSPELDGSVFLGWYLDFDLTSEVVLPMTVTQNMTLFAKWRAGACRVSFETNGGSAIAPIDKNKGEIVEESEVPTPTRAHYTFKGWYLDPSFETEATFPIALTTSITLYAKWEAETYTVNFSTDGGTPVEAQQITYGGYISTAPETTKAGYEFLGWYFDSNLTNPAQFPLKVEKNITLFAKWKEIVYLVSFNSNGAANYPAIEKKYGEYLEASEVPTPSKDRNTFLGWYLDFDLTEPATFPIKVLSNITLHAKWEYVTTFSVRFDANGGSGGAYYIVENGESINAAPSPTRAGYVFGGWYLDQDCTNAAEFPFTVTQSVVFYAKWEPLSYTVSYVTNGGSAIPGATVGYGEVITELPTPTKEGFVFLGWYLDASFNTPAALPIVVTENISFYAKWREVDYCTVYFNNDGVVSEVKVEKGSALEQPEDPVKEGYTFLGWYLDADFNNPANFPYLITNSMTFYAKWQKNETLVTVTFETNGGTAIDPVNVVAGETIQAPANPVSARGEFLGWYLEAELINLATFPLIVNGNMTLYAKYASYEQSYTVTFETNGGSQVASQIVYATGSLIAPSTIPTKPGYTFGGWYLDAELLSPANFPMSINANTTLYAKWNDDVNTYRVTIHDGVNADSLYLLNPGESVSRPDDPTRTGYIFGGWYLNESCTGQPVSFPYTPTDDVTLYAKWTLEVVEHSVTWVFNNGKSNQEQTVDNGSIVYALSPSYEGYEFLGWYLDAELTEKATFPYRVYSDVTFYGKWEKLPTTYTVTYVSNGGTAIPTATVNEGSSISAPSSPTRSGYIFTGWYLDAECTQKATFPMNITQNTSLYAGWRVDEFASFTFEYSESLGGYVITDYEDGVSELVLPTSYDDGVNGRASVVAIGKSAFENCASLVSIVIPDTIVSIGDSAFYCCSSLASISIPASVTSLGSRTFYKCTALASVDLPESISSIGAWSFYGCSALTTISLPSMLSSIGDYLFYSSGLEKIVVHSKCLSIGNFAFYNCANLEQVDIMEGCTSIGNNAFRACVSLRQITIPITVTTIGSYVFVDDEYIVIYCSHANNLSGFDTYWARLSSNPEETSNAPVIYNFGGSYARVGDIIYALLKDGTVSATYIGSRDVTSIILEAQVELNDRIYDVTSIGTRGFRNLTSLTSVTLSNKLQSIGTYAFQGCTALEEIVLPSSVLTIESYAFNNCKALSHVELPNTLTTIGDYAFRYCTSLKEIYIPRSVISISNYAFSQCKGIVIMYGGSNSYWLDAENYVLLIQCAGKYYYQDGIYYTLTSTNTVVVSKAESGILTANILSEVEFDGVKYSVISVGPQAFSNQTLLTSVVLPDSISTIESYAFSCCTNLSSVSFGNGLTSIMDYAFYDCDQLRVVEIRSNLQYLGGSVFYYCDNHVTVLISGPDFSPNDWCFNQMNNYYASVTYDYAGKYVVIDYVVYALTNNGVTVAGYIGSINSLTIRDTVEIDGITYKVTSVSDYAFRGLSALASVTFGSNVETIGRRAFAGGSYTEIVLPQSIRKVGEYAFEQSQEKTVTIYIASFSVDSYFDYSSINRVYYGTVGPIFIYDENEYGVTVSGGAILLTWNGGKSGTLELPDNVTDGEGNSRILEAIGGNVFYNSNELTKVTLPVGLVAICNNAFSNCNQLQEVVCRGDSLESIGNRAFDSCTALNACDIFHHVKIIGGYAFFNCYNMREITFGEGLTEIGESAFWYCNGLQSVVLPDSLRTIKNSAFQDCSNATITLGNGIETIGATAFYNCRQINPVVFGDSLISIGENAFLGTTISFVYLPASASVATRAFNNGVLCFQADSISDLMANALKEYNVTVLLGCKGIVDNSDALYVVFSNGEATLAKYSGSAAKVEILSQVTYQGENYPVTSIATRAFKDNTTVNEVTLPDTLVTIGSYAFYNCSYLSTINWNSNLKTIESHAFEFCPQLKNIILPNGLETIGMSAFASDPGATVFIPSSVTSLGNGAFSSSSVYIASTSISADTIATLTGCDVKTGCVALYATETFEYAIFSNGTATALRYFGDVSSLEIASSVTYEEQEYQLIALTNYLLSQHYELEQVTLPATVSEIAIGLFYSCSSLETVVVPNSVRIVGDSAFDQCYSLSSISLGNSVESIGNCAFRNCNSLTEIVCGNHLVSVGDQAFYYCSSLKNADLGDSLEEIGMQAFYYCNSLKTIAFGDELREVGESAFYYCSALTSFYFTDKLTEIKPSAFYRSGLASVELGAKVNNIGNSAFCDCNKLKAVKFDNALESIGDMAFSYCYNLADIRFGTGLRTIGSNAFNCCYSINHLILPNGLVSIGGWAFSNITMSYAYIPSTVTSIGNYCFSNSSHVYFGGSAISNPEALSDDCTKTFNCAGILESDGFTYILLKNGSAILSSYTGDETNIVLSNVQYNGREYEITSILSRAFQNKGIVSIVIPSSVETIGEYAFYDCHSLASVELGSGLRSIGRYAFCYCYALTSIVFNDALETIGENAFYNCSQLASVEFGSSLESIGNRAFYWCNSLRYVELPSGLESLGEYAFYECYTRYIYVPSSVMEIGDNCFNCGKVYFEANSITNQSALCGSASGVFGVTGVLIINDYLYVLKNSGSAELAAYYGDSSSIVLPDSVSYKGKEYLLTLLHDGVFSSRGNITSVELGSSIEAIGNDAFYGCYSLRSIAFPASLKSIGDRAFYNCSFQYVYVPSNVTEFGDRCFTQGNIYFGVPSISNENALSDSATGVFDCAGILVSGDYLFALRNSGVAQLVAYSGNEANLVLPDEVTYNGKDYLLTELKSRSLSENYSLETVVLGANIELIGDHAFYNCGNLTSVTLSSSTKIIGNYAFYGCYPLATVANGQNVEVVGSFAFYQTNLSSLEIGAKLISIGERAFAECHALASFEFGSSLETIGDYAFYNCLSLSAARFGSGLRSIGIYAFAWSNLSTIELPSGLTSIGEYAFSECPIGYVYVPATVTSIGDYCFNRGTIYFGAASLSNPNAVSQNVVAVVNCAGIIESNNFRYVLKNSGVAELIAYFGNESSLVIPDSVSYQNTSYPIVSLSSLAFKENYSLSSISLGRYVESIGDYAFTWCQNLSSIEFTSALRTIGQYSFYYCTALRKIELPSGLTAIGERAFSNCPIEYAYVPAAVATIGDGCFTSGTIYFGAASLPNPNALYDFAIAVLDCAGTVRSDNFFVILSNSGVAELSAYTGNETNLVLPDSVTYKDVSYPITSLKSYLFQSQSSLTSVTLGKYIETIGDNAFVNCTSLSTVEFGSSLRYIGQCAFADCNSLASISLGNALESIGSSAFQNCSSLASAELGSSLKSIGDSAFSHCTSLVLNALPDSLVSVGNYAFNYCWSLTSLKFGSSLESIGSNAFYNCNSLASIEFGSSLRSIGVYAFSSCPTKYVFIPSSVTSMGDECFTSGTICFASSSAPNANAVGYNCTTIFNCLGYSESDGFAFVILKSNTAVLLSYNGNSQYVIVPSSVQYDGSAYSVTSIGKEALRSSSIKYVFLPESISEITYGAISGGATVLTPKASLPNELLNNISNCTIIYSAAGQYSANGFTYILFKDGTATLASYAGEASSVTILGSITVNSINYRVTKIGSGVFNGHSEITSVTLPESVEEIEVEAFVYCTSLSSIDLSHVKVFRDRCFQSTSLNSAILTSATYIGRDAFYQYEQKTLVFIYVGSNVEFIGYNAFWSTMEKTILLSVSSKGDAWSEGWNYSNYSINCIWNCTGYATSGPLLYYLTSNDENLHFALMDKTITSITLGDAVVIGGQEYAVTAVSDNAFANSNIETVVLTDSITAIGNSAFSNCVYLKSIVFDKVITIGSSAFYNCQSLESIHCGSSLKELGESAFYNCKKLASITLPLGLTKIGYGAFSYCESLAAVYIPQTVSTFQSQWDATTIFLTPVATSSWDTGNSTVVYNATSHYFVDGDYLFVENRNGKVTVAKYYGKDKDLVVPSSAIDGENTFEVGFIAGYCFYRSNITSIVLPDTLIGVRRYAFYNCDYLARIEIKSGNSFDYYAFYALPRVELVLIHSGVIMNTGGIFVFESSRLTRPIFLVEGDTSSWPSNWVSQWSVNYGDNLPIADNSTLELLEIDNVLYTPTKNGQAIVVGLVDGVKTCVLPETITHGGVTYEVKSIARAAFARHLDLEEVVISSSVSYVGEAAFAECYSLVSVIWRSTDTSVRQYMFCNDMMLENIVFDTESPNYLAYRSFYACSALTSIVLPASITSIENEAFAMCLELAHIYSRNTSEGSVYAYNLPNDLSIEYGYQDE